MTNRDRDDDAQERLRRLSERIERFRSERAAREGATSRGERHYSQVSQGWRMVSELVAGLVIGVGIGYGLDVLFGTLPVFLVLFTLLGFVAGVRVMMRTADEVRRQNEAGAPADKGD